ncbi:MAG: chemotaxis protein CheW, partial [Myxococcota bacterium]
SLEPAPAPVAASEAARPAPEPDQEHEHKSSVADTSIRVNVEILDTLMNLVGELVLARNQILQHHSTHEDANVSAAAQRLNLVTSELQEGVMRTRMQPIGQVWSKFPRVVRDLAHQLGKQCRIEMEGKETELDKTILEAIKDPLTHLVRNSVDHGFETAEERVALGKSPEGTLTLRAFHEGGQVNIEISDDGSGVNLQKVADKALQHGLMKREQLERMTEKSLLQLIFLPGFSTAQKVTNVSGRGVGMDVVKTNIEKIGGTIDVSSSSNGTTFKIKIPLTLAIVPALVISSGGDRYAIPQVNLVELVRLEEEQQAQIERINGTPVYRLRGNLLPLVFLNEELRVERMDVEDTGIHIAVLQAGDELFGLVVEQIHDTEEIVVKPLSPHLKSIEAFSGATIMGDGRVALILDTMGLAAKAGLASKDQDAAFDVDVEQDDAAALDETLLLFEVADERVVGVPLAHVQRLEEFPATRVERAGRSEVVQYREQIMPLTDLGQVLFGHPPPPRVRQDGQPTTLQVIVCQREGFTLGLVVDRLIEIVEERVSLDPVGRRHGVVGSAVVQGRVIEMVDVEAVIGDAAPGLSTGV